MKKMMKVATLTSLLVLATALTGCIKAKQALTLMPNGAGKIDLKIGFSEQMMQMTKQQGEDPFSDLDPRGLAKGSKGLVAFTKPEKKTEGGYTYMMFSAYFEDINAVELGSPDENEEPAKFTYKREGDNATFTADQSMVISAVKEHEPIAEDEKAFVAAMLTGLSFSEQYTLPGRFADIKGVKGVDNTATLEITGDDMLNGTGPFKELKGVDKLTFAITGIKDDKAKAQAFEKELAAAKAEWEKMQEEAEAE